MAMCVMAVVGVAPCQCFSPGGNQTTSPGRISSTGPPSRCARPQPDVTTKVWPSGCVCHAVRAPGSKVTRAPATRAGSGGLNSGSIRTVPVNQSDGPLPEGCEPLQLTFGRDGKLVSGIALMHGLEPAEYVFTKTQYAGIDVHMAIVRLLRYLTEKYFAAFEMVDESGFWEEEDEGKLRSQFGAYERVMDQVSEMVEAAPAPGQARGDEARGDELVKRLEAVLRERRA